jgi:AcrR family transcriptional regulator
LLNVAERLFLKHGLDVSVRDITAAAKTNSAAIHYYFGSRDGLVAAVIERHWDDLAKLRREALDVLGRAPSPPSVRDVVVALVDTFVAFVDEGGPDAQRWLDLMNTLWVERSSALELMAPKFTEFAWQELLQQALPALQTGVFESRLTLAIELIITAMRTPSPSHGIPTYPLPSALNARAHVVIDSVVGLLEAPSSDPA